MKKKISATTIILIGSFILYFVLGMFLSYYNEVDQSLYFGSDNSRAYQDLIEVKDTLYQHYRITVHPLMMILLQPVTGILAGIFHDARMGLIVLQALMGAGCVTATYKMLDKMCKNKMFVYLLLLVYTFSFSNIIFSSVPETFIFSGFFLSVFWLYILEESSSEQPLTKRDYLILSFFGISSFGITITNYISYFIGVFYLLCKKHKALNKEFVRNLFGIHILNVDIILVLTTLQQKIWLKSPTFLEGICDAIFSKTQYEEFQFMNFAVGFQKLRDFLLQFLCMPILSADVEQIQMNIVYVPILFRQYSRIQELFLILFLIAFALSLVRFFLQKNKTRASEALCVLSVFSFNFLLHYFYGYDEAFMYSPHYLFLFFLLWGICLNGELSKRIKITLAAVLGGFICFEVISNFSMFFKTTKIIQDFYGNYYSYLSLIGRSLCLGILIGGFILAVSLFITKVSQALQMRGKILLFHVIGIYAALVLISALSIYLNYWRI